MTVQGALHDPAAAFALAAPEQVLTVVDGALDDLDEADLLAQLNGDAEIGVDAVQMASVYQEITDLLVAQGIPRTEIAWVQDARTPAEREALFARMRDGQIRVMLASTHRMGVGVNVQTRLYAMHHLTTPWRPCDVKQADGRGWRPGNLFPNIWIKRYIASPSFDGFSWQGIETKGKFEDAYLRGDPTVRTMSDIDEQIISAGEIKALASGDPRIVQKVRLEHELTRLKQLRDGWEIARRKVALRAHQAEMQAATLQANAQRYRHWLARRQPALRLTCFEHISDCTAKESWRSIGKTVRDRLIHWAQTIDANDLKRKGPQHTPVGDYRGLPLVARLETDSNGKKKLPYLLLAEVEHGDAEDAATWEGTLFTTDAIVRLSEVPIVIGDIGDVVPRLERAAHDLEQRIALADAEVERLQASAQQARAELDTPWEHAHQWRLMELGLRYLNASLNEDKTATEEVIGEVLALAESEGLDIEAIIAEGNALHEQGPDLSRITVAFPPLPEAVAISAADLPVELHPSEAVAAAPMPKHEPAEPTQPVGPVVSLSLFADPLPISRPTLDVAGLDLHEFATEAARKKAELAAKRRQRVIANGQTSFFA
jgi:hypothetical protein